MIQHITAFSDIDAVVFDIGDVLVDISYDLTVSRFQALSNLDFQTVLGYSNQYEIFNQYERGELTTDDFIAQLKKHLREDVTDQQVIAAWNSMLVHFPSQKIDLLMRLKSQYRLFALSNINELHVNEVNRSVKMLYGVSQFSSYFEEAIYSNEVGMRKPEPRIYEHLIKKANTHPANILFIDDKLENIQAANNLGISTIHLTDRNKLVSIFEV
jgi:epoxide hydrolase-like predicted phosphatase